MAAAKPEVLVSQLLHEILTKFQRLRPHYRGSAFQWSCCEYCCIKPEARNPRWRLPNRKYMYRIAFSQDKSSTLISGVNMAEKRLLRWPLAGREVNILD